MYGRLHTAPFAIIVFGHFFDFQVMLKFWGLEMMTKNLRFVSLPKHWKIIIIHNVNFIVILMVFVLFILLWSRVIREDIHGSSYSLLMVAGFILLYFNSLPSFAVIRSIPVFVRPDEDGCLVEMSSFLFKFYGIYELEPICLNFHIIE